MFTYLLTHSQMQTHIDDAAASVAICFSVLLRDFKTLFLFFYVSHTA